MLRAVQCDVAWLISGPGQPTPELGVGSGLCSSEVTGAAAGLKTPGAAFGVPERMAAPNALHQAAGARMGGEPAPAAPSVWASLCSLMGPGGSERREVFRASESG